LEDSFVIVRVFDFNGREVDRLYSGALKANQVKTVPFERKNLMSGIYICKLTTESGHSYNTRIIIE
ncbi:MAG: T9SS type A sorting domain-containing protein, partial [Candidatus Paceibacterota bacterium]